MLDISKLHLDQLLCCKSKDLGSSHSLSFKVSRLKRHQWNDHIHKCTHVCIHMYPSTPSTLLNVHDYSTVFLFVLCLLLFTSLNALRVVVPSSYNYIPRVLLYLGQIWYSINNC